MRLINILRKKCTICGSKCDDIKSLTSKGFVKEWCCDCTVRHVGRVTYCKRCL